VERAADFAAAAGDGDGGFDGDAETGERAGAAITSLLAHAVGIEVDESVQPGIEALDLRDVGVRELGGRDFLPLKKLQLLGGGQKRERHGESKADYNLAQ